MTRKPAIPKWIDDDPEEIEYNEDGSAFIPIGIIENKLTKLDPFWSSNNLQFQIEEISTLWKEREFLTFVAYSVEFEDKQQYPEKLFEELKQTAKKILDNHTRIIVIDGSIEITVTYGGVTRTLVGAATMPIEIDAGREGNFNFRATIKAEATKNAVKGIGPNFGSKLNDRDTITIRPATPAKNNGRQKPPAVKLQPDLKIQAQYNHAVENKTGMVDVLEALYEIKYTGEKANVKG